MKNYESVRIFILPDWVREFSKLDEQLHQFHWGTIKVWLPLLILCLCDCTPNCCRTSVGLEYFYGYLEFDFLCQELVLFLEVTWKRGSCSSNLLSNEMIEMISTWTYSHAELHYSSGMLRTDLLQSPRTYFLELISQQQMMSFLVRVSWFSGSLTDTSSIASWVTYG